MHRALQLRAFDVTHTTNLQLSKLHFRLVSNMTRSPLEEQLASALERRRRSSKLRDLKYSRTDAVDFSSNDFLSLSTNAAYRSDYLTALGEKPFRLGSTGSRLLDGHCTFSESLEKDVAAFHSAEASLLTNSGFDANVSIFGCLPQPGDVIVYDELIHASVHDGMRQSRAEKRVVFRHNDVEDLRRVLESLTTGSPSNNIFIAVESVYSMEGDLAPLQEISSLLQDKVSAGKFHLIVDEAHATGIYGHNGVGRVSELGLERMVSIRLHTFGKALACNGAAILCSPIMRLYLINYARPLIYTTFMSYPSLMAIYTSYDWMKRGKTTALAEHLNYLIQYLFEHLQSLSGLVHSLRDQSMLSIPDGCPESPIFALLSTKPRELASHCQAAGFVVRALYPPTVPEGTERVRVCLHAGNTTEQIDQFVATVRHWLEADIKIRLHDTKQIPAFRDEMQGSEAVRAKL